MVSDGVSEYSNSITFYEFSYTRLSVLELVFEGLKYTSTLILTIFMLC